MRKLKFRSSRKARDVAFPLNHADAMVRAVRANGPPIWYVVYDAGHESPRRPRRLNLRVVLFVQKFLLN